MSPTFSFVSIKIRLSDLIGYEIGSLTRVVALRTCDATQTNSATGVFCQISTGNSHSCHTRYPNAIDSHVIIDLHERDGTKSSLRPCVVAPHPGRSFQESFQNIGLFVGTFLRLSVEISFQLFINSGIENRRSNARLLFTRSPLALAASVLSLEGRGRPFRLFVWLL
jgi:hypothetical protein